MTALEPFKSVFSPQLVRQIAGHVLRRHPDFDAEGFSAEVVGRLDDLELKARAQAIADALHARLPRDHDSRGSILRSVLHPDTHDHANRPTDDSGICGWGVLPLTLVVGQHGTADFDGGMALLREMTMRFSSEFAVRYFLLADQARALRIMADWTGDPNRHVRRLVSEGARPRLPWAMQLPALIADPVPALPLLSALRDDPEDYVRRSVANHLNDISKDHPALVTTIARHWTEGAGPARMALLRHACRSLIKQGDPQAFAVFGQDQAAIEPLRPDLSHRTVAMGDRLAISARIVSRATKPQRLTVDYVLHLRKANGRLAPKVFKGATLVLLPDQPIRFTRTHRFAEVTTRRHYPGEQAVSLRINGWDSPAETFVLLDRNDGEEES